MRRARWHKYQRPSILWEYKHLLMKHTSCIYGSFDREYMALLIANIGLFTSIRDQVSKTKIKCLKSPFHTHSMWCILVATLLLRDQTFSFNIRMSHVTNSVNRISPPYFWEIRPSSWLQGGEDSKDLLSCRSFSIKEPLNIGHLCGKRPIKIRDPMSLRHPVVLPARAHNKSHPRSYIDKFIFRR